MREVLGSLKQKEGVMSESFAVVGLGDQDIAAMVRWRLYGIYAS